MSHSVDRSPLRKRILIPFWVLRILILLAHIVIYGLAIGSAVKFGDKTYRGWPTVIATYSVYIFIFICCLALDITCIVKRGRRTLSPLFFLMANVIVTSVWTVLFMVRMLNTARPDMNYMEALSVGLGVFVYLVFMVLLIYAVLVFRRSRKDGYTAPDESHRLVVGQAPPYMGGYPTDVPLPAQHGYSDVHAEPQGQRDDDQSYDGPQKPAQPYVGSYA